MAFILTKEKAIAFLMVFIGLVGILVAVFAKTFFVYRKVGMRPKWDELNIVVTCTGEKDASYLTQKQIRAFADLGGVTMITPVYSFSVIVSIGDLEQQVTMMAVSEEWLTQYAGRRRLDEIPAWGNCYINEEGAKHIGTSASMLEGRTVGIAIPDCEEPFETTTRWLPTVKVAFDPLSKDVVLLTDIDYLMWILETYYPDNRWPEQEKTLAQSRLEDMHYTGAILVADTVADVIKIHEEIAETGYKCSSVRDDIQQEVVSYMTVLVACSSGGTVALICGLYAVITDKDKAKRKNHFQRVVVGE